MSLLDDLAFRLVSQGVGKLATSSDSAQAPALSIFKGSASPIPAGAGPFLTLAETGGPAPTRVQNKTTPNTRRPTVQVLVRAGRIPGVQEAYPAARAMSDAAYLALDGIFNTTLNGTFYIKVTARQDPTDMGMDATGGRALVVFNLDIEFS